MLKKLIFSLLMPLALLLGLAPAYANPPANQVDGPDAEVIESIIGQSDVSSTLGWQSRQQNTWDTNLTWNNGVLPGPLSQIATMDISWRNVSDGLNLSGLQSITNFTAVGNQLTSLTLHQVGNHTLTTLNVSSNQLSSLDVSNNLALTDRGGSLF